MNTLLVKLTSVVLVSLKWLAGMRLHGTNSALSASKFGTSLSQLAQAAGPTIFLGRLVNIYMVPSV